MKVAISQSNYIPWKGYFDLIANVDVFVIYDDMQYTKRDWRNRNKIKTPQGTAWLSVPVQVKGKYFQKINETTISDKSWTVSHWSSIRQNYINAPFFDEVSSWLKPLYSDSEERLLSLINYSFIGAICKYLNIKTEIRFSSEFALVEGKTERLADLCDRLGASHYVSGPSAKDYIEERIFLDKNIRISWFDNNGYPQYPQMFGEFEHSVTILDLLFNVGTDAGKYMKFLK